MLLAGLATQRNQSVQQKLDELRADASSEQWTYSINQSNIFAAPSK